MSTAGKVLTVLILLVMVTWIVMLSAVTQLNVNWQQKIAAQDKQFEKATEDLAKASRSYINLTESTRVEQANKDRDLREIGVRIAAAEAGQSATIESLSRLKYQVAGYQAAVKRAETNNATRKAEKAKATEDLAQKRDLITKAQATNAELRDQLAKLQDEFKQLLADNKTLIDKAAQGRPAPRPASSGRPSPSS